MISYTPLGQNSQLVFAHSDGGTKRLALIARSTKKTVDGGLIVELDDNMLRLLGYYSCLWYNERTGRLNLMPHGMAAPTSPNAPKVPKPDPFDTRPAVAKPAVAAPVAARPIQRQPGKTAPAAAVARRDPIPAPPQFPQRGVLQTPRPGKMAGVPSPTTSRPPAPQPRGSTLPIIGRRPMPAAPKK